MKTAATVLVLLYASLLVLLTVPVTQAGIPGHVSVTDLARLFGGWPYWAWLALMLLSEAALLVLPVKTQQSRPVSRRSIHWMTVSAGFLMGLLGLGLGMSLAEGLRLVDDWGWKPVVAGSLLLWIGWAVAFGITSRNTGPQKVVKTQSRLLKAGSLLTLLVAVPTHIVVRARNECCAGYDTFVGIAFGLTVMLLAFGPGVLFLYAARARQLKPEPVPQSAEQPGSASAERRGIGRGTLVVAGVAAVLVLCVTLSAVFVMGKVPDVAILLDEYRAAQARHVEREGAHARYATDFARLASLYDGEHEGRTRAKFEAMAAGLALDGYRFSFIPEETSPEEGPPWDMPTVVAVPDPWSAFQRYTYVSRNGDVYRKDTKGERPSRVPHNPWQDGWISVRM